MKIINLFKKRKSRKKYIEELEKYIHKKEQEIKHLEDKICIRDGEIYRLNEEMKEKTNQFLNDYKYAILVDYMCGVKLWNDGRFEDCVSEIEFECVEKEYYCIPKLTIKK